MSCGVQHWRRTGSRPLKVTKWVYSLRGMYYALPVEIGSGIDLNTVPQCIYQRVKRYESVVFLFLDMSILLVAYVLAFVLMKQAGVGLEHSAGPALSVFFPALLQLCLNKLFGLYGHVWRYASIEEALRIISAVFVGFLVNLTYWFVLCGLLDQRFSWPLPVFASGFVLMGVGGVRFRERLFALERGKRKSFPSARGVIVGADDIGVEIALEFMRNADAGMEVVGFVDEDPWKVGRSIRGIRVLGISSELPAVVEQYEIDYIVLSAGASEKTDFMEMLDLARSTQARVQVVPSPAEVASRTLLGGIGDVDIPRLLDREQVQIDFTEIEQYVEGSVVLVTGAGGSIGSEIARQVARFRPRCLLILDCDETHLHDLLVGEGLDALPLLANIRDQQRVERIFSEYRPDVVFHAAAHKHVPLLQQHPEEAVLTNVIGTRNLVTAAAAHECKRFLLISTDKAARPGSVMGATKRLAEILVRETGRQEGLAFGVVRFGNVLGSRGSVVPTFVRQIMTGGPVTLTHPDMTRYFMSIPEAVSLVLRAGALLGEGDTFHLDMGEPVRILDLAHQLIRQAGLRPGSDIKVEITGLRPGERLSEQLHDESEQAFPTDCSAIVMLDSTVKIGRDELRPRVEQLNRFCKDGARWAAVSFLQQILVDAGVPAGLDIEYPAEMFLVEQRDREASNVLA